MTGLRSGKDQTLYVYDLETQWNPSLSGHLTICFAIQSYLTDFCVVCMGTELLCFAIQSHLTDFCVVCMGACLIACHSIVAM